MPLGQYSKVKNIEMNIPGILEQLPLWGHPAQGEQVTNTYRLVLLMFCCALSIQKSRILPEMKQA